MFIRFFDCQTLPVLFLPALFCRFKFANVIHRHTHIHTQTHTHTRAHTRVCSISGVVDNMASILTGYSLLMDQSLCSFCAITDNETVVVVVVIITVFVESIISIVFIAIIMICLFLRLLFRFIVYLFNVAQKCLLRLAIAAIVVIVYKSI